jgi:hypothetical protein
MAHDHHHAEDRESYFLDQLCTIALTGAFAGACIALYLGYQTWDGKYKILDLILANKFDVFLLWAGIALTILVVIRAISLWIAVGQPAAAHDHDHDHDHDHGHDCCHDHGHTHHHHHHGPGHVCDHDHNHEHDHGHAHSHDHVHVHAAAAQPAAVHAAAYAEGMREPGRGTVPAAAPEGSMEMAGTAPAAATVAGHVHTHDCGHDHGWAPWRYMVLLIPIMIFFLRLPGKPPQVSGMDLDLTGDSKNDVAKAAGMVGAGPAPLVQLVLAAGVLRKAEPIDFKRLELLAADEGDRQTWAGRVVRAKGQLVPGPGPHMFSLVRLKIQCCAADVIQVKVGGICQDDVSNIPNQQWVTVEGQVGFAPMNGKYYTFLKVAKRDDIKLTEPDYNPYIQ